MEMDQLIGWILVTLSGFISVLLLFTLNQASKAHSSLKESNSKLHKRLDLETDKLEEAIERAQSMVFDYIRDRVKESDKRYDRIYKDISAVAELMRENTSRLNDQGERIRAMEALEIRLTRIEAKIDKRNGVGN